MHLVYASDENYLKPMAVAIAAAYHHASRPEELTVHVLSCEIPDAKWKAWYDFLIAKLPRSAKIVRHDVSREKLAIGPSWHSSYGTYARLYIDEFLPDIDWCVYCDVDTLFTDDPFKLEAEFENGVILKGASDPLAVDDCRHDWYRKHKLPDPGDKHICAGFLVMDLSAYREGGIGRKCVELILSHPDIKYPDQDALNINCAGRTGILARRWGLFSWDAFVEGMPGCIHFAADLPWKVGGSRYPDLHDAQLLWFKYAKKLLGLKRGDFYSTSWRWRFLRMLLARWALLALCRPLGHFPAFYNTRLGDYYRRHYNKKGV